MLYINEKIPVLDEFIRYFENKLIDVLGLFRKSNINYKRVKRIERKLISLKELRIKLKKD